MNPPIFSHLSLLTVQYLSVPGTLHLSSLYWDSVLFIDFLTWPILPVKIATRTIITMKRITATIITFSESSIPFLFLVILSPQAWLSPSVLPQPLCQQQRLLSASLPACHIQLGLCQNRPLWEKRTLCLD